MEGHFLDASNRILRSSYFLFVIIMRGIVQLLSASEHISLVQNSVIRNAKLRWCDYKKLEPQRSLLWLKKIQIVFDKCKTFLLKPA
jgi:hypothetical protein